MKLLLKVILTLTSSMGFGWSLAGLVSSHPAASDPYVLAASVWVWCYATFLLRL